MKLTIEQRSYLLNRKPETQVQEVLHELLTNGKTSAFDFMTKLYIMNHTARISDLRTLGVDVVCETKERYNKFGRKITYGVYWISNIQTAFEIYKKLKG